MPVATGPKQTAIIIGSGIGGMSMAIILAKLGFDVTVIEKNRHPGGMLRSYVRKGVHCNVGLHYLGALDRGQVLRRCFDYLGITHRLPLQRMGGDGPVDRYYFSPNFPGPRQFDLPSGIDGYEVNLKQAFPEEHFQIDRFMQLVRNAANQLDRLDFLYEGQSSVNLIDQMEPMGAVLSRLGCSPGLKGVLSPPSGWIGVPMDRCPQFYHTMSLASYLLSAWRLETNGAHLADVLADRLDELGGTLVTGSAVESIDVQNGRVCGVTLADDRRFSAPLIVAAVHPRVALNLLDPGQVKSSYRRRIVQLKNTAGMVSVNALVTRQRHEPLPYNVFAVQTRDDGSIEDVIYMQLRPCEQPDYLQLSLLTSGHETLWKPWEHTRTLKRGTAYTDAKMELAAQLIERVEPITGRFGQIEVIDVYTPLSIRDWVNSPEGSAYGVMRSEDQMLSAAILNRTTVKGLYLAGQSVMAPGVLGTIFGSLITAKFIVGPQRFHREARI
jgi:phytoene dehydrogenase-like protein